MKKRYLVLLLGLMLLIGGCSVKDNTSPIEKCNLNNKDDCRRVHAVFNQNEVLCQGIDDSAKYNDCISKIAAGKLNVSICALINSPLDANACISQVAVNALNPSICSQITETNKRVNQKDLCLAAFVAATKDSSQCELIQGAEVKQRCRDLMNNK